MPFLPTDCQQSVGTFVEALATPGLTEILDFQYVAYGNANWNGSKVQCQHGPNECFGNIGELRHERDGVQPGEVHAVRAVH